MYAKKEIDTLLIVVRIAFAFLQGIKAAQHILLTMQNEMDLNFLIGLIANIQHGFYIDNALSLANAKVIKTEEV